MLNTQESVMPMPFQDKVGQRFGKLIVKKLVSKKPVAKWVCVCDCGNETQVWGGHLKSGVTRSCGCLLTEFNKTNHKTHGMTKTRTYVSWRSMISRCTLPSMPSYKNYGGKGIGYDPLWQDFQKFLFDMGERPQGMTLDRIDSGKSYSKDNCRWATPAQQQANRKNCMHITYNGITQTAAEWATQLGLSKGAVWNRIKLGWSIEKAVTTRKVG
jgi:hypothetical protein